MNCKTYQNQIDELTDQTILSAETLQHLEGCVDCRKFNAERAHLREMLRHLESVNAPADFNFHLKARLRKQKAARVNSGWRKLIWVAPTAFAAVAFGFVLTSNALIAPQPESASLVTPAATQIQPAPEKPQTVETPLQNVVAQSNSRETLPEMAISNVPKAPSSSPPARRETKSSIAASRRTRLESEKDLIRSKDSALDKAEPSVMPLGIPNPLQTPQKLDVKELLLTYGVQTTAEADGLRVLSVSNQTQSYGLKADDVIEQINNQKPAALSNSEIKQLNLTVRRKEKTLQVKITN